MVAWCPFQHHSQRFKIYQTMEMQDQRKPGHILPIFIKDRITLYLQIHDHTSLVTKYKYVHPCSKANSSPNQTTYGAYLCLVNEKLER